MRAKVKANVNIALIKYWGKMDDALKLPTQSSLSFTVDAFYTITEVTYDKRLTEDTLTIDDVDIFNHELKRVQNYMNSIRKMYHIPFYATIKSWNHVPKAAGVASSSSAFAALGFAATKAFGLDLRKDELSRLFRLGSGSASRSIDSGFIRWDKGHNHETSYATKVCDWEDFRMIVCLISEDKKHIGSGEAMKLTMQHTDYPLWIKRAETDLVMLQEALLNKDIDKVGSIAQNNALYMHDMIHKVGIDYFKKETYELLDLIKELQQTIPVYATMDAGPNVKIMTLEPYVNKIEFILKDRVKYVVCKSGQGLEVLS